MCALYASAFLTPSLRSRSSHRGRRRGTQDHSEQLVLAEFNPSETQDPMEKEPRRRPPPAARHSRRPPPPPNQYPRRLRRSCERASTTPLVGFPTSRSW
jgi:hypothetical protein